VAIIFDVLLTVTVIALVWNGLRTRPQPASSEEDESDPGEQTEAALAR
jgi:hypothetical protein